VFGVVFSDIRGFFGAVFGVVYCFGCFRYGLFGGFGVFRNVFVTFTGKHISPIWVLTFVNTCA